MRECGVQNELSVYMEWHNTTMLSGLCEPSRILDNGSIDDLLQVDLSANRIMILDISNWNRAGTPDCWGEYHHHSRDI
jgi:hypothetical protein